MKKNVTSLPLPSTVLFNNFTQFFLQYILRFGVGISVCVFSVCVYCSLSLSLSYCQIWLLFCFITPTTLLYHFSRHLYINTTSHLFCFVFPFCFLFVFHLIHWFSVSNKVKMLYTLFLFVFPYGFLSNRWTISWGVRMSYAFVFFYYSQQQQLNNKVCESYISVVLILRLSLLFSMPLLFLNIRYLRSSINSVLVWDKNFFSS